MSRRALVLSLALAQTVTLSGGALAALSLPAAPSAVQAAAPEREPALHPVAPRVRVARPKPVATQKPAPKHVVKPAVHRTPTVTHTRTRAVRHRTSAALTPQQRMMRAVHQLVGYRTGDAQWQISSAYGHWGVANLNKGIAYISPTVPSNRMYDVVAHEWSHLLSIKAYDGDVSAALAAMNAYFGGSGLDGAERAADCMARVLGADWTHYTSCQKASWRDGARRLLARRPL
jgi:hypothetical protein